MLLLVFTSEVETNFGGGERDFHEVGLLELAVTAEVIDDGDFPLCCLKLATGWFDPDFGPFGTGFPLFPFLGQ